MTVSVRTDTDTNTPYTSQHCYHFSSSNSSSCHRDHATHQSCYSRHRTCRAPHIMECYSMVTTTETIITSSLSSPLLLVIVYVLSSRLLREFAAFICHILAEIVRQSASRPYTQRQQHRPHTIGRICGRSLSGLRTWVQHVT